MSARARSVSWLHGLVTMAGGLVVIGAVVVALHATTLSVPSVGSLLAACRAWLVPQLEPVDLLVFALGALSVTVLARATGSAWRAHRSARAFARTLRPCEVLSDPVPACVIDNANPVAFCAGLLRPQVYISAGALDKLDAAEVKAVLVHEAHHAARHDPLRLFLARVLADALFFLPVMRPLQRRYATLAELAADEAAIAAVGSPQPLASAMLAFGELDEALLVGVSAERVDHLLGHPPGLKLPLLLLAGAIVTVAGLGWLVLAGARAGAMGHISIAVLLMQSCGPLMVMIAGLAFASILRRPSQFLSGVARRANLHGPVESVVALVHEVSRSDHAHAHDPHRAQVDAQPKP